MYCFLLPIGEREHHGIERAPIEARAGGRFTGGSGAVFGANTIGAVQLAGDHARLGALRIGVAHELQRLEGLR